MPVGRLAEAPTRRIARAVRLSSVHRPAFTIVELLVVLVILAAVAGLLVPLLTGIRVSDASGQKAKSAEQIATETSMRHVLEAVMGSPQGQGYYSDMGALPTQWPTCVCDLRTPTPSTRWSDSAGGGPICFNRQGGMTADSGRSTAPRAPRLLLTGGDDRW
jgi:prepilin-type N-terminal cleavage/methylation domain-containing protein